MRNLLSATPWSTSAAVVGLGGGGGGLLRELVCKVVIRWWWWCIYKCFTLSVVLARSERTFYTFSGLFGLHFSLLVFAFQLL